MLALLQSVRTLLLDVRLTTKTALKEGCSWRITPTGHSADMWCFKFSRGQGRWVVGAGGVPTIQVMKLNRETDVVWGVKQNPKPTPNKQRPPTWHAVGKSKVRTQTNSRQISVEKHLILLYKDCRKALKPIFFICNEMESVNHGITPTFPSHLYL